MLIPLDSNVVIKTIEKKKPKTNIIYTAEKDKTSYGAIISVGKDVTECSVGDRVTFLNIRPLEVENHIIVPEDYILFKHESN